MLIILCLAPWAFLPFLGAAAAHHCDKRTHYRLDPATYRQHAPIDPATIAAAVKRHDRPYLGPRNKTKR